MKKNNFQPVIRITWGIFILCLIAIAIMIKIYLIDGNFDSGLDFLVYSIPIFISSLVFIMLLYNLKRAYADGQKEIDEGNCIAHWKYEDEEWTNFNSIEWKKSRKKAILIPLGCLIVFYLIGIIDPEFSLAELAVAGQTIMLFLVSLSIILLFYNYSLYKRTKICPREVLIGPNGFLYGGFYNGWNLIGTRLADVKFIQGEVSILEFDTRVWGKYGEQTRPLRIPVPKGCENEAEEVIAILTKKQSLSSQ